MSRKEKKKGAERVRQCANLCNHALESDIFIVYLLLPFPPFLICNINKIHVCNKGQDMKPNVSEMIQKKKKYTFGVGQIGVFAYLSSCHPCRYFFLKSEFQPPT